MHTLTVAAPSHSYPIFIGQNLLAGLAGHIRPYIGKKAAVITNETVAPLYLAAVQTALDELGTEHFAVILPDGEQFKNWQSLNHIYDKLLENRAERGTTLIALGGGVIGDTAGFAAATYQRGVAVLQIPTTLLAQVDSSVGGKTGVNHPQGKNLIGAFHQPQAVLIDTATLATLPPREFAAGMAEVVKYGLINDPGFFAWLEANRDGIRAHDPALLAEMIAHCCANKAAIVAADEREQGERALLNYGHTFGHALEALTHYNRWKHGEAVAIGSIIATRLGVILGRVSAADAARTAALFAAFDLPATVPADITTAAILDKMQLDKKTRGGTLRLVLPQHFCASGIDSGVPAATIRAAIDACRT